MEFFRRLGKALMLPVCVLPVCGILMGVGYALCPAAMQGGEITGAVRILGFLLVKAGSAAIDNMAVLFAIGVAVGMTEDGHGSAALAGIVSWFVITTLLSVKVMTVVYGELPEDGSACLAFSKIQNPTIGILSGLIGASCYNRFKNTRLPDFLAFFSGRRSVSIVTVLASVIAAFLLAFVWPIVFGAMVAFGKAVAGLGGIGCGIYAFLNRLLIPTGMHHAINNVFWFDTIGLGDLTNYWAGKTSEQVGWDLGMYMSGFFPCMIGGIPGAALAFYHCAKNKKKAAGVLFSTAFCAFLCGMTEPFEFSFMFLCFPLYVVYSVLYGLFSLLTWYVGFRGGFSFSAGLIDLVFSSTLPAAEKTLLVLPLSAAAFALFYFVFRFMIRKYNIPIPGAEEGGGSAPPEKAASEKTASENTSAGQKAGKMLSADEKDLIKARGLLRAVGGRENVISSDCCATRLRLELKDSTLVDEKLAKKYGALGCHCPSPKNCQIIIGLTVQQALEAFRTALQETAAEEEAPMDDEGKAETQVSVEETVPEKNVLKKEYNGRTVKHGEPVRISPAGGKAPAAALTAEPITEPAAEPAAEKKLVQSEAEIPVQREEDGAFKFTCTLKDPLGIHVRPAAQIAEILKKHGVRATVEANGKTAQGNSPLMLLSLGAKCGTEIRVSIDGDAGNPEAAAGELAAFFLEKL